METLNSLSWHTSGSSATAPRREELQHLDSKFIPVKVIVSRIFGYCSYGASVQCTKESFLVKQ